MCSSDLYKFTSTYTMTSDEWVEMNLYSIVIQCFHFGGILQVFALYLHQEKGVKFSCFYKTLMDFVLTEENPVSYCVFSGIKARLQEVIKISGELTCQDKRFGNVMWPLDEYAFLLIVLKIGDFYKEVSAFLAEFDIEPEIFESLMTYQQNIIKLPFDTTTSFSTFLQLKIG